jgi:hypothetical protein
VAQDAGERKGRAMVQQLEERLYFEAVVQAERSLFATDARLTADNLQQFAPPAERATQAASALQSMDFRVRHVGTFSISGDCPRELWESVFGTRVERRTQPFSTAHSEVGEVGYCRTSPTPHSRSQTTSKALWTGPIHRRHHSSSSLRCRHG